MSASAFAKEAGVDPELVGEMLQNAMNRIFELRKNETITAQIYMPVILNHML